MILAIDIGNSNTVIGFFENNKIKKDYRFVTKSEVSALELQKDFLEILSFCEIEKNEIRALVISNVVPALEECYRSLAKEFASECLFVKDLVDKLPFKISIYNQDELGEDRIVNAVMGFSIYNDDVIIVDFGTALNFDIVTKEEGYIGGVIYPGIGLAADYLAEKTAKLPHVALRKTEHVVGKDTVQAIESGLYNGYDAVIAGMIDKIKTEHKRERV